MQNYVNPYYPNQSLCSSDQVNLQPHIVRAFLVSLLAVHSLQVVGTAYSVCRVIPWSNLHAWFTNGTFFRSVNLRKRRCFVLPNLSSGSRLLSVRAYVVASCLLVLINICRWGADQRLWFSDDWYLQTGSRWPAAVVCGLIGRRRARQASFWRPRIWSAQSIPRKTTGKAQTSTILNLMWVPFLTSFIYSLVLFFCLIVWTNSTTLNWLINQPWHWIRLPIQRKFLFWIVEIYSCLSSTELTAWYAQAYFF
jgi:hypothetical protein